MILIISNCSGASATSPKRVLILNPFGRDVAPFSTVISAFRVELGRELGEPVEFFELPLDLASIEEPTGEGPLLAFLRDRIKSHPVDLAVAVGGGGVMFAVRHRERLFPDTPILVVGADLRLVPPGFLQTNATLVTQRIHLPSMVEDILQMQPQTTNIAVVFGASAVEKFWVGECRREFASFTNRVGFTWLNELPLEKIVERCAALPPRSFILHGLFVTDAAGFPCEGNEALRRLHATANAPLFGYLSSQFGLGPIGGRLFQDSGLGAEAARIAIRILRGERPENIPPQVNEAAAPVFDWRELRRWNIPETGLPAGSVIMFREPGFWDRYRWPATGVLLFALVESALIVSLLVNRRRRIRGEQEANLVADISSRFVNLTTGDVDREISDAQGRICRFLDLDSTVLWQTSGENSGDFVATHAYQLRGGPMPSVPFRQEDFPWVRSEVAAGRMVVLGKLDDMPAEAAKDTESARGFGIKSSLTIPLSVGGAQPIGVLSFNAMRRERSWPAPLVNRLQLVAQIFGSALGRRRADQALRESEARITLAAEAAQFGVWVWNIVRNQVWGSERWLDIFGFSAGKDINFEAVIERIHPDDRVTVEGAVRRAMAGGNDYAGEFRAVLPDGTLRWIASRGRGYTDANGATTRMMGAAIDITERKRAEMETQELRGNLIHLTRASTIGALSGSLAHELNQPLGIILSNAQAAQELLLQDSPDLGEVQAILSDIVAADRRAGKVIERLRALFKRGDVSLQQLSLNGVIEEVLQLAQADLIGRGVTVVRELAPDLPPISGDRVQLQQLVLNLILNASDAMAANAPGERRLCIRTMLHQGRLRASVRDEGSGLPAGVERLFEPFYTTKSQGLGMGLAICRSIVDAHAGRLWAEPNPGRGAVFHFELPVTVTGDR